MFGISQAAKHSDADHLKPVEELEERGHGKKRDPDGENGSILREERDDRSREEEEAQFDRLRAQKLRLGTNDLAIAAVTLSVDAILVTRNTVDFQRFPNLRFEDWGH